MIIDCKKLVGNTINTLKRKRIPKKKLVAVLVGYNKASISFLKQKQKIARELGIEFEILKFKSSIAFQKLKQEILRLNQDIKVGGIIIQLPLPKKFDLKRTVNLLSYQKDVDALSSGARVLEPAVCVVQKIFRAVKFNPRGKRAVVVGRGFLVGQPVGKWLKPKVKELTVTDKGILDKESLKQADVIVSGVGKTKLIKPEFIKKGVLIIDFGFSKIKGKMSGDVDFERCKDKARFITSTPGGTGPMLVAELFENFYKLNK